MPTSAKQLAKRAFVTVLLEVARACGLSPTVNRDTPDKQLEKVFKKVCLKAHPDKGGSNELFQKLQGARDKWKGTPDQCPGRPAQRDDDASVIRCLPDGLNSVFGGGCKLRSWLQEDVSKDL